MNRNIEVINENLYAVNMQYVKAGYIAEMKIIPNTKGGQINLSNTGKIVNTDELVHTARSSSACFPVFQCTLSAA